jgi:hypothetical protein
MKNHHLKKRSSGTLFVWLLIPILIGISSCGAIRSIADAIKNSLNDTNQILDQAVNDLNGNAANYGHIMEEAIDKIDSQDIKAQLQDALDNAIVTASTEIKCNIQFTADYLVKRIKAIKAKLNNSPVPPEEPQICTVIPSIIDMNRPPNQRNAVMITGYFLNEEFSKYKLYHFTINNLKSDRTTSLSVSTDFKLVVNLGSSGITLDQNSGKLVLMWDNVVVSEIQVVQHQPEPCDIREREFINLPKLVIYPVHKKSPWKGVVA